MKRLVSALLGAALVAAFSCQAHAQANMDTAFDTPGNAFVNGTVNMSLNAASKAVPNSINNPLPVSVVVSAGASTGIVSVVSAAAENNHVLKATAGNMISVYAVNLTATPGFLVVTNTTAVPADGAVTPLDCVPLPANGSATVNYGGAAPAVYSTGISAFVSSATTCFTKTTGVITAFINGRVR